MRVLRMRVSILHPGRTCVVALVPPMKSNVDDALALARTGGLIPRSPST